MIRQGQSLLKEGNSNGSKIDVELKQINFLDKRCYKRSEDKYYPSVTTILAYMPKSKFFESWLKDVGHNADIIVSRAGKEGTQVHEAVEDLVLGKEVNWMDDYGNAKYSEVVWQMILRFHDFWTTHKPKLISTEEFVYSDEYEYAGTADLVVEMDGEIWLLDIKTSNTLHKSYDLQLAAYAQAMKEVKGIQIQRRGIVWLKASTRSTSKKKGVYQGNGWQIKEAPDQEVDFDLFKTVYKLYKLDNPVTQPIYKEYPLSLKV